MKLFTEAGLCQPRSAQAVLGLLLALLAVGLLYGLNAWGPLETSEARYAEIAREMLASGDWLHPRLLGIQHFHKPPLTYWLTALGLAVAGPTAAGVRLLPALAVLAQVGLVYGLGLLFFPGDRLRAVAAAVVYGTLPVVLISALNITTDVYLATLELAAAYAVLRYYQYGQPVWLYCFWLALGLAFLTKGPVGLVLPLMAVAGFYFRQGRRHRPFTVHHALGAGLFLVVGFGWYLYLAAENPAFVRYFLFNHTVERFANPAIFGRSKPWWFYWVLAPVVSLPWSGLLLVQAMRTPWATLPQAWRNVWVFWVLVPLGFFSLSSSKLLLYVLPAFPGVALLAGYYLGRCTEATLHRWQLGMGWFLGVILGAIALLPMVAGVWTMPLTASLAVAAWPAVGLALLRLQHVRWRSAPAGLRVLLAPAVFTLFLLLAAKTLLHQNQLLFNGTRPLAERLQRLGLNGRQVVVYNQLLPSLAFELGQIPVSLFDGNSSLRRETQFEADRSWQHQFVNLQDSAAPPVPLAARWPRPPLLVVKGALKPERHWLRTGLWHEEQVGPWRIYHAP
ncbi:glycosyltransferase family 39 protein [Hymenobacter sp. BT683]|uniref:Glycosyltransferase family 39 protein n=1 Tax=Hymenobacter jeongseonensis TaxID=2791027 RepID=A0ABS0IHS6_9BACT|nr:glycosyltransferase family 39 protein [Hymenobacter jeongseonensis]MBF9237917.1 glycosyltransferase family 39 protein [Hymenobacter jeongseonensis]